MLNACFCRGSPNERCLFKGNDVYMPKVQTRQKPYNLDLNVFTDDIGITDAIITYLHLPDTTISTKPKKIYSPKV